MKGANVDYCRRRVLRLGVGLLVGLGLISAVHAATPSASGTGTLSGQGRSFPSRGYYGGIATMYAGDYREALKIFQFEGRGGIKNFQSQWIDSICYHTMTGEAFYRLGDLPQAFEQYTSALKLFVAFHNWMQRVSFPTGIRPAGMGAMRRVPWGASTRQAPMGFFPENTNIMQGQFTTAAQVQQGGVIQQPVLLPINVQEIVRCTTLAALRRGMLLGPARLQDALQIEVEGQLAQRPGPANHWAECWIDLEQGAANIARGKEPQAALNFQRAVLANGQYDHPLTGLALLELGMLALQQGSYPAAAKFFEEATYAAVNYSDLGTLEEAFRFGAITHFMSNQQKPYPLLLPALTWAKRENLRELQASLAILGAENCVILGDSRNAAKFLDEARHAIGRRTMGDGIMGARLNFVAAAAAFQQKRVGDGELALVAAMKYMRNSSLWLFQISLADGLYAKGEVTPRTAMELYGTVLRDPQPADWASDPMESLSVLVAPHQAAFEHWFEVAMSRKEYETALEIGDRMRRHRFFSTLRLGGRLESLRWLLEGPTAEMDQAEQLHRQDILARYPQYKDLQQQQQQVLGRLNGQPPVAQSNEALKVQMQDLNQVASIAAQQEAILREMAVRREAAEMVFPPIRSTQSIQKALPAGHALLAFVSTSRRTYAFLLNSQRYTYWQIAPDNQQTQKLVTELLRDLGHYEGNKEFSLKELADEQWKRSASTTLDQLLKGSAADFTQPFEELVIVPDGALWYLPFEMLQVRIGKQYQPLISRFRMCYVPLASLAVPAALGRKPLGRTAVVVGQLFSRDSEPLAKETFQRLARVLPGSVTLPASLPAPSSVYLSLFDRLVVLDQIAPAEQNPYAWAPVPIDRGKPGSSLEDWMGLPFDGPQEMVFPGFHTVAENALKRVNSATAGQDVFLSVCGLLASGGRTVLLSRWRTGGQTSLDLTREFAQELPHTAPSDAWQRAIFLTLESRVNPENEPRVKRDVNNNPPNATHPFFWAGYLLVDTTGGIKKSDAPAEEPVIKIKNKNAAGGPPGGALPAEKQPAAALEGQGPAAKVPPDKMTVAPGDLGAPNTAVAPPANNAGRDDSPPKAKPKANTPPTRNKSRSAARPSAAPRGIPPPEEK